MQKLNRSKLLTLRRAIDAVLEDMKGEKPVSSGKPRSMKSLIEHHRQNFEEGTWKKLPELRKTKIKNPQL